MDAMVLETQRWLNHEYSDVQGWVSLKEDGITGWGTIGALTRALQHELGIATLSSNFGETTSREFTSQIGVIDSSANVNQNVLRILSGSLWCKGYPAAGFNGTISFEALSGSIGRVCTDLGIAQTGVNVKLMKSLLSMDAYVIPSGSRGSGEVREFQQWLNGMYSGRKNFALIPCDGIPQRNMLTGVFYAIQFEIGMDDETANGYFGPGTKEGLRTRATVQLGSVDNSKNFVHLCQGSLRLNGYQASFDGVFGSSTQALVRSFQSDMQLESDGVCGYGTWCAMLVSCGDETRSTAGFDTNKQLTLEDYNAAKAAGYSYVGRYTVGAGKFISSNELASMKQAGMLLFPIHQRFNNSVSEMTEENGLAQGIEAVERARALGLPNGSILFFCVDFDPTDDEVSGPVSRFFKAVHDTVTEIPNWTFEIGVYGTRNVCESIISKGFASTAFVAGMSWGWSGNMGFPMPKKWSYNQIAGSTLTSGSKVIDIDKVVVSSKATSVSLSDVTVPPTTQKGEAPTATGFDMLFEWVVRAEVASERAGIAQPQLAEVVLGFLRKPTYWSEDLKTSLLWQAYTPEALIPQRAGAEQLMSAIDTTKDVQKEAETGSASYHDYPHLAASTLGYLCHPEQGSVPVGNVFSLGDLGAWELDLITLWRDYLNSGAADLRTYMRRKFAALPAGDSSMSFADTIADADAYMIASELLRDRSRRLSTVLRTLYKQDSVDRFAAFYAMRFQGSKDVFSEVLRHYTSPEYYQVLESIFGTVIDFAFNIPRRPTESELSVIADVVYESAHGGLSVY